MKRNIARRPYHRTTLITTDRDTYTKVKGLAEGEVATVTFANDIISSASGGNAAVHHPIRRVELLRRQVAGGFRKVRVRYDQGLEVPCVLEGTVLGAADAPACSVKVTRSQNADLFKVMA